MWREVAGVVVKSLVFAERPYHERAGRCFTVSLEVYMRARQVHRDQIRKDAKEGMYFLLLLGPHFSSSFWRAVRRPPLRVFRQLLSSRP